MNMSGRRTSRLAASFNATLAGSQVQGLLDGASISSNEGVSGIVPQGADQLLDDVTTHSSEMDHDDGQGPVRPEDLDHPHNIGTPNHPPGIPNPAVNYAELTQTAERYKQLLEQAQMQNLQNVQTIQALTANQNTMEAQMLTMRQNIQQLINTANAKEAEHARVLEETENRVRQAIEERIRQDAEANNPVDPDEQAILEAEQKAAEEAAAMVQQQAEAEAKRKAEEEIQRKAAEKAKHDAEVAAQNKAEQEAATRYKAEKAKCKAAEKAKQEAEENNKKAVETAKRKAVEEAETQFKHQLENEVRRHRKDFNDLKQKQEREQAMYQSRLNDMAKEIAAIKTEKAAKQKSLPQPVKYKNLSVLRQEVVNTLPGTVNLNRGGAVPPTGVSINWGDSTIAPPNKQVHFGQRSSTPRRPMNFQDVSHDTITSGTDGPVNTARHSQFTDVQHPEEVATAAVNSTVHAVASELRKMKEPKLAKLKGGYTTEANLFFQSWAKDVQAIVIDRQMSDNEALQLIKEHTEGAARRQVDNYLDFSDNQTFSGLMKELSTAFESCQDEASLMADFYSRKQLAKENDDEFAEQLQLLARKVICTKQSFRTEAQQALKQQFANGLKDQYHQVTARSILKSKPDLSFVEFRSEIAGVLHTRGKRPLKNVTTNVVEQVECDLVGESQQPSKRRKKGGNTERDDELKAMVAAVLEDNKRLSQKIERMESNIQTKVLTQAVSTSGPATHSKPHYNRPYNNKYQGKPREPKDTPGTDGSLDLNLKCAYCGDNGHHNNICPRIKARDEYRAAQAAKAAKPSN